MPKYIKQDACPKCGCVRFIGHQRVYMDVVCDSQGGYVEPISENCEKDIEEADKPYGPFTCEKCGTEYDELPITVEMSEEELIEKIQKILEESGRNIDFVIHDIVSERASNVNNTGIKGQAKFFLEEFGEDPSAIKRYLE